MKNLEALIKKVETFEKLAVYGDRRTFLQSLAQDAEPTAGPKPPNPEAVRILEEMRGLLQQVGSNSNLLDPINNALMFKWDNDKIGAIGNAVMQASNKMTGIADSAVSSKLFNLAQKLMRISYSGEVGGESAYPEDDKPVSVTTIPNAPRIDKEEQRALGKIVTIEGIGLPLEPDGVLGPKTKAAIEAFKKKFKFNPFTKTYVLTDEDALTYAKMLAESQDKYK